MTAVVNEAKDNGAFESVRGACAALCLPRSSWYRLCNDPLLPDPDIELRDQIQNLAVARSVYGYRRMTAELKRSGVVVNHKRVLRIMREDNLLCLRRRRFIATTDFGSRPAHLSQPCRRSAGRRHQSALGIGHHLHPAAR